jgi:type I restriction enzyme S subunit
MSLWAETTLKKVAEKISYGYTTSAIEQNTGIKFLRITDIASGAIDWNTVPYCEISEIDLEKCLLTQGDIVIARTGATVGYAKQIRPNSPKSVFASYLVRVKLKNNV